MDLKETKTKELLTLQQLFNTGIHLGHRTSYWNAKMAPYIFGIRNDLHIINIEKSLYLIRRGMQLILQVLEQKGTILIVGNSESNQHFVLGFCQAPTSGFTNTSVHHGTEQCWQLAL